MTVSFRRLSYLFGIVYSCALLCILIFISLRFFKDERNIAAVWLSFGFQIAVLTLTERSRAYILAMFLAAAATMLFLAVPPILAIGSAAITSAVAIWSAWILRNEPDWIKGRDDRLRPWLLFVVSSGLIAPGVNALLGAPLATIAGIVPATGNAWLMTAVTWFISDALSVVVVTTTLLRLGSVKLRHLPDWREMLTTLGVIAVVAALFGAIAVQDNILPIFLVASVLVVVLYVSGTTASLVCLALFVTASIVATILDDGPFIALASLSRFDPIVMCQIYALAIFCTVVLYAGLLGERLHHHKLQLANAHIYEMLAKRSGDIVFAADSYGKILFISPSIGEVLGVPLQTAEMRGWKNYVAKGDVKKIYKTAFRVIRTGKPVSVDFRIIDAKGREKILEAIVQTSSAGKATIVIGSMRDVTEQRRHERALSRLSETDPLTELPNRRAFDRYFRAEWNRSFAAKASMSILMIDVDYFKQFNDTFGHQSGDECLVVIGSAIRGALKREGEFCARFGGEEFVAILPNTDEAHARKVAARVLSAIADLNMAHTESPYGIVTVSIGVAASRPLCDELDLGLLEAADAALYLAKQRGRNRVEGPGSMA